MMMDASIAIVTCHESMSLSHNCDGSFLYFICSVRTHLIFTIKDYTTHAMLRSLITINNSLNDCTPSFWTAFCIALC